MNITPVVSVFVPVYNNLNFTKQLIDSLKKHDAGVPYELIIIDNNSTDGTREYLHELQNFEGINGVVIENVKNNGFAIANNQAFKESSKSSKYVCLLNNDTVVTENWLGKLVEGMERHEKAGIVGSKLIHPGTGKVQHAGVYENSSGYPQHAYFGRPGNYSPANVEKRYMAVTGACMLIRKELYEKLGGLDERYWCGWEDIDFCNKASMLGYEIWYIPESVVYHYEGQTEGRMIAEGSNFNLYMSRWVLKNEPFTNLQ